METVIIRSSKISQIQTDIPCVFSHANCRFVFCMCRYIGKDVTVGHETRKGAVRGDDLLREE